MKISKFPGIEMVYLTDTDKENISRMPPDNSVYCNYDPDIFTPEEVQVILEDFKRENEK